MVQPLRSCAFCQATEDVTTCDWPVMDFVPSTYAKLNVGDKVRRISEKVVRPAATIAALDYAPNNFDWFANATMRIVFRKANGQEIEREVYGRSPVRVLRDKNCDTPCCGLHRCERGPGATYCQSHWRVESGETGLLSGSKQRAGPFERRHTGSPS